MNIAMMTNNYKPFIGGVPISVERLAESLRESGHNVWVFAPEYHLESERGEDGFTIRYPTAKKKIAGIIPIPCHSYERVNEIFRELEIDIIHVHHPVLIGGVACRLAKHYGIPLVFTYHTRYDQYLHYFKPFARLQRRAVQGRRLEQTVTGAVQYQVVQRYINSFVEKCDMVFAPTESIREYLRQYGLQTPVQILPTGLPKEAFSEKREAEEIRKKYLQGRQYLFSTTARLAKEKNVSFMLRGLTRAKAQLGDVFRVLVIGDGPEREALLKEAVELGIGENVIFTGKIPNAQVAAYHQACDAFLFASLTETQGIVLLEAMACGLPVVAVEAPGTKDVVRTGENGILTAEDIKEWSDALMELLKDKKRYAWMREQARETALCYRQEFIAGQAEEYYEELLRSYQGDSDIKTKKERKNIHERDFKNRKFV